METKAKHFEASQDVVKPIFVLNGRQIDPDRCTLRELSVCLSLASQEAKDALDRYVSFQLNEYAEYAAYRGDDDVAMVLKSWARRCKRK